MVTNEQLALKNQEIGQRLQNGESWFRIALSLQPEICQAARELSYSKIQFSLLQKLRMAVWFADFYERARGNDIYKCSWDKTQDAKELWRNFFNDDRDLGRDVFLSQCWALGYSEAGTAARAGKTSEIWTVLKDVFRQCLELDSNEWTIIENYDNPPEYFKYLMSHRDTATWRDFAEFIDDFRNCETNPQKWHSRLFDSCQERLQNRAKFGVYLQWRKGAVATGIGIGVDHVKGRGQSWKMGALQKPTRPGFYPLDGPTIVSYPGHKQEVSPQIKGVYYRYVSNPNDSRYHWWKRVEENTPIPPGRKELLICFQEQQHVEPRGEDGVSFENIDQFALPYKNASSFSGQSSCCALRINIANRPTKETILKIAEGWHVKLAGKVPHIEPVTASTLAETKTGLPVWAGDCGFQVSDLSEGREVQWECRIDKDVVQYSQSHTGSKFICELEKSATPCVHDVRLTARIEGLPSLYYHFLWIPQSVMDALEGKGDVPEGWDHSTPENEIDVIQDRLQGHRQHSLTDANGCKETLFLSTHATDFWFVQTINDVDNDSQLNQVKAFSNKGEAQIWTLVVPGNVESLTLEIGGQAVAIPEGSFHDNVGAPSVWRINLGTVFRELETEYSYTRNPQLKEIRCNGITAASFSDVPIHAVLCRNAQNQWGVFIPANDTQRYTAILYTDNTKNPHFLVPDCKHGLTAQGGQGEFICLEDWITQTEQEDAEGELWLGLIPEGQPCELHKAIANGHPLRAIRRMTNRFYSLGQDQELLLKSHWRVAHALQSNRESNYHASRLAKYTRPLSIQQGRERWKDYCQSNHIDALGEELLALLDAGYNFLVDAQWYFHAYDQLGTEKEQVRETGHRKIPTKMIEYWCPILIVQKALDIALEKGKWYPKVMEPWFPATDNLADYQLTCTLAGEETLYQVAKVQEGEGGNLIGLAKYNTRRCTSRFNTNSYVRIAEKCHYIRWDRRHKRWQLYARAQDAEPESDEWQAKFQINNPGRYVERAGQRGGLCDASILCDQENVQINDLEKLQEAIQTKVLNSSIMNRNGMGAIATSLIQAIPLHGRTLEEGGSDAHILLLCGLAVAINNIAIRDGEPENWLFEQTSQLYQLLAHVVRACYKRQANEMDPRYLKKLMHEILYGMRLLGIFDLDYYN